MSRLHWTIFGMSAALLLCAAQAFCADQKDDSTAYFKLVNVATGKVLALENDSAGSDSQAQLATDTGAKSQQWKFDKSGDFNQLVNRAAGLALDVAEFSNDEGGTIIVYDVKSAADQNDNQLWSWDKNAQAGDKGVRIKSKSSNLVLDAGSDGKIVQNSAKDSAKSQLWRVVALQHPASSFVKLVNSKSGWVLGVEADANSGSRAMLVKQLDSKDKNSKEQEWKLVKDGNYLKVVHRTTGLVLDVSGDSQDEDNPVIVYEEKSNDEGNDNQRWAWDGDAPTKDQPRRLKSKLSGLALDFDEDGNAIQRSKSDKAKSQSWTIIEVTD
jgi:hypothetical protein